MSQAQPPGAAAPGVEGAPQLAYGLVAFAAVYLVWGSTYLAIRWAIESIPPILMAAVRFLVAGGPLLAWQRLRGGGAISWAAGSIYSRHARDLPPAGVWVAMQMLAGGILLAIVSVVLGEPSEVVIATITAKSFFALLYLIFFGAIVGYGAYIWLLRVVAPARVATYAYVNPVVAMVLGWALADEPLTGRSLLAAAVILVAVVLITTETDANRGVAAIRERGSR